MFMLTTIPEPRNTNLCHIKQIKLAHPDSWQAAGLCCLLVSFQCLFCEIPYSRPLTIFGRRDITPWKK